MWMFHYMVIRSCLNIRKGEGRCRDEKTPYDLGRGQDRKKRLQEEFGCLQENYFPERLSVRREIRRDHGRDFFFRKKSRQKTGSIDPAFCRGEEKELYESIQGGKTLNALMESR